MDNPKISVIIPMYNRKHYIAQCIDSALNQTFKEDYEIIIRDDGSTDGSYDFVAENYSQQISEGKIKLRRNKKNFGEFPTSTRLFKESKGKYVMILHSDDMYLPHALEHLYEVAEQNNADVVHAAYFFTSPPNGVFNDISECTVTRPEHDDFDSLKIMPEDPVSRFDQWFYYKTFWDAQYNIFNRDFIFRNKIFFEPHDNYFSALFWIMLSKVFIKTPIVCYVYRDSPDSATRENFSHLTFKRNVSDMISACKDFNNLFSKLEFFRNNELVQHLAISRYMGMLEHYKIFSKKIYQNGLTPEIYELTSKIFKEHFGESNYVFPMLFFNWVNAMFYGKKIDNIYINNNASPQKIQQN